MSYSYSELIQCIAECMVESLPQDWESASMNAYVHENEVDVNYRYYTFGIDREQSFNTANVFAPLNAMHEIYKKMKSEGKPWNNAVVKITKDGNFTFKNDGEHLLPVD